MWVNFGLINSRIFIVYCATFRHMLILSKSIKFLLISEKTMYVYIRPFALLVLKLTLLTFRPT